MAVKPASAPSWDPSQEMRVLAKLAISGLPINFKQSTVKSKMKLSKLPEKTIDSVQLRSAIPLRAARFLLRNKIGKI